MPKRASSHSDWACKSQSSQSRSCQTRSCCGISYTLKRSSRRRISVQVTEEAQVVVHAGQFTPLPEIEALIDKHKVWILKSISSAKTSPRYRAAFATQAEQAEWKALVSVLVPELVRVWERRLGVKAGVLSYRNMKSRWGSCNVKTGRICINTRLALYPPECLEYVVVHELCHLIEANHGKGFYSLMTAVMPDWKERKKRLG